MTRFVAMTAIAAVMGSAAFAGNLSEPVVEPVPAPAPVPVVDYGGDWTGFYLGGQVGQLDAEADNGLSGDDTSYGVHGGYNHDFGRFVLGGEIEYDEADVEITNGVNVESVARGKVKAGYDFGSVLGYVTAGVAQADTSIGDETGEFYGIGMAYKVNDQWSVGGEVLEHNFDEFGNSGVGGDATSVALRASFHF